MTRGKAIVIGLASLWPILYLFVFLFHFVRTILSTATGSGGPPFGGHFAVFFGLHVLTMLLSFGLMIYFIVHLFRNASIPPDKKPLWAIVLFMGGMAAMPIYWFLHLWRPLDGSPTTGATSAEKAIDPSLSGEGDEPR